MTRDNSLRVNKTAAREKCLKTYSLTINGFPIRTGEYFAVYNTYFSRCLNAKGKEYFTKTYDMQPRKAPKNFDTGADSKLHFTCERYTMCPAQGSCSAGQYPDVLAGKTPTIIHRDNVAFDPVMENRQPADTSQSGKSIPQDIHRSITGELLKHSYYVCVLAERLRERRAALNLSLRQVEELLFAWHSKSNLQKLENPRTKRQISRNGNLSTPRESTEERVGSGLSKMGLDLCCCLAAIYRTTPGYLMGQSDGPRKDIYIVNRSYYNRNAGAASTSYIGSEFVLLNTGPDGNGLEDPLIWSSGSKRAGRLALNALPDVISKLKEATDQKKAKLVRSLRRSVQSENIEELTHVGSMSTFKAYAVIESLHSIDEARKKALLKKLKDLMAIEQAERIYKEYESLVGCIDRVYDYPVPVELADQLRIIFDSIFDEISPPTDPPTRFWLN